MYFRRTNIHTSTRTAARKVADLTPIARRALDPAAVQPSGVTQRGAARRSQARSTAFSPSLPFGVLLGDKPPRTASTALWWRPSPIAARPPAAVRRRGWHPTQAVDGADDLPRPHLHAAHGGRPLSWLWCRLADGCLDAQARGSLADGGVSAAQLVGHRAQRGRAVPLRRGADRRVLVGSPCASTGHARGFYPLRGLAPLNPHKKAPPEGGAFAKLPGKSSSPRGIIEFVTVAQTRCKWRAHRGLVPPPL